MTKKWFSGRKVRGLSTDSKPTNPEVNAEFYETDTKKTFDYTGGSWVERTSGLTGSSNLTLEGKTQSLGDWVIMQKTTPSVATNLVANVDSATTCTLTYDLLDTDKISAVRVQYSLDNSAWTTATSSAGTSSYQVTGLTENASYYFRVYSTNIMGERSTPATTGSILIAWITPQQVTGLALVQGDPTATNIAITWSAPVGYPEITYTIEHSLTGTGSWSVVNTTTDLNITDVGVSLYVPHYYRVKAVNSVGEGAYSTVSNITVKEITAVGATSSTSGAYTYHEWTSSGTLSVSGSQIEALIIGGGGGAGAGYGGGGGAGELKISDVFTPAFSTQTVTIGAGGDNNTNGGDTSLGSITSKGGGGGGSHWTNAGLAGGSGGGGGCSTPYDSTNAGGGASSSSFVSPITGNAYANIGGSASGGTWSAGGGGGGAGGAGGGNNGGSGRSISQFSQFGVSGVFAGGGGGSRPYTPSTGTGGTGGAGGGGHGWGNGFTGDSGTDGTGSGGGSGGTGGGSGIVIVRHTT